MGTTYSIRIVQPPLDRQGLRDLQAGVDALLEEVNRQMSTWQPDSEISRFNRAPASEPFPVSPGFLRVVRYALDLAERSGGAFDPTVGALVDLWGFGPDGAISRRPSPDQIAAAEQVTGYRHLSITPDGALVKDIPGLQLDLGAVAKGHGVDQVAALLRKRGLKNFLVEIGGETLASGLNPDGQSWRVGVLRPDFSPSADKLQGIAHLPDGMALATSGDYRNFFRDENNTLQTHIIDPRTGAPVQHTAASVSVLATDCLSADGLATALLVLGPDEGLRLLHAHFPRAEALFLLRKPDGSLEEIASPGFLGTLGYESLSIGVRP